MLSEKRKAYLKKWREDNKEYMNKYMREHPQHREKALKKWKNNNPSKVLDNARIDREKNRLKYITRNKVNNNNLKKKMCEECGSIENLEFHHTDYINNIGITVCRKCHGILHRRC